MNHRTLVLIAIFASLIDQNFSLDSNFDACVPQKCGKGPAISYPFRIPNQKNSLCGLPGFEITCKNETPRLKIANDDYIVEDVFYTNNTFLLVNTLLDDLQNTCPIPRHNFSLNETPFQYSLAYTNLSFFYNCSTYYDATYKIPCSSNATSFSFALFHEEILVVKKYPVSSCQSWIHAPAESESIGELVRMNFTDVLRRGFTLQWSEDKCRACNASGGRCGSLNSEFTCFCPDRAHPETCRNGKGLSSTAKIGIGIGVAGGVVLVLCLVVLFICRRRIQNKRATSRWVSSGPGYTSSSSYTNSSVAAAGNASTYYGAQIFSHSELDKATNHFDTKKEVGDGGFGAVYKGKLKDGRVVAVKRLYDHNFKRVEQFMNEIEILTRLRHQNLVSLYGCTTRQCRELLLVYEYIPNGTVADHLHGPRAKPGSLSWTTRLNIALESASALAYLHASDVIHRDVKTNNILLDNNFTVKVADFGLSRLFPLDVTHVSTAPQGTPGYVDPEYHQCYHLTDKSDVYSFGVVLIELVSSQPAVDITRHRHEINLSTMAINKIQNHALHELVDPNLGFETDYKVKAMITKVAELAFRCLQGESDVRPTMVEVLETLKGIQRVGLGEIAVEMDVAADEMVLLKSDSNTPVSPDSGMMSWSTANSSGSV